MKSLLVLCVLLAGCHSAPSTTSTPAAAPRARSEPSSSKAVTLSPAEGFFLLPDAATFAQIARDDEQRARLQRGELPPWRRLDLSPQIADDPTVLRYLPTVFLEGQRWTIARPAHAELVGPALAKGVSTAKLIPDPQFRHDAVLLELRPPTSTAMYSITTANPGRPLLVVLDSRVIAAPIIRAVLMNGIVITGGRTGLPEATRTRLLAAFGR